MSKNRIYSEHSAVRSGAFLYAVGVILDLCGVALTISYNYEDKVYAIKSLTRYDRSKGGEGYVYVYKFSP